MPRPKRAVEERMSDEFADLSLATQDQMLLVFQSINRQARRHARPMPTTPAYTDEQMAAIQKAVFDNDYSDISRLKALGRWLKTPPATQGALLPEGQPDEQ